MSRRLSGSTAAREIAKPIVQMAVFVVAAGAVCSTIMLLLAFLLRGTGADRLLQSTQGIGIVAYTVAGLPQVVIDGMTIGFVYAAIALGYTMVYGVLQFINFAHSEIFAIGAFAGVETLIALDRAGVLAAAGPAASYGWFAVALLAGMLVAGVVAVLVERIAYRPLRGAPKLVPLISALGVSFALQDSIRLTESLTTGQFFRVMPTFGNFDERVQLLGLPIAMQVKSLVVVVAALVMLVALNYFVRGTKVGKAIRAVAQDQHTAALMGISVNGIIALTFFVGGSLGGAAGVLYALKFTRVDPFVGFMPGIKAFAAAVLGGIGNLTGALLGGVVLGMLESFAGAYLGTFTMGNFGAEYKDMVAFLILALVIVFRPHGLLGESVGHKA